MMMAVAAVGTNYLFGRNAVMKEILGFGRSHDHFGHEGGDGGCQSWC